MNRLLRLLAIIPVVGIYFVSTSHLAHADRPNQPPEDYTGVWVVRKEGKKVSESSYKDGKLHGLSTRWHANGKLQLIGHYKEDRVDGVLTKWDTNGLMTLALVREADGKMKRVDYIKGHVHREQISKGGQLLSHRMWHLNGSIALAYICKDGKPHGEMKQWHPNGKLKSKGENKEGRNVGVWTGWDEHGNKNRTWHHKDGGITQIKFYESGKLVAIEHWKDGKSVRREEIGKP